MDQHVRRFAMTAKRQTERRTVFIVTLTNVGDQAKVSELLAKACPDGFMICDVKELPVERDSVFQVLPE